LHFISYSKEGEGAMKIISFKIKFPHNFNISTFLLFFQLHFVPH